MTYYPNHAGYTDEDTSKLAADRIERKGKAATLRQRVYSLYEQGYELTADEVAMQMGESVLNIRPRCSELFAKSLIEKTGKRRLNAAGSMCAVFRKTTNEERK